MTFRQHKISKATVDVFRALTPACAVLVALLFPATEAQAAISWDAGSLRTDAGHEGEPAGNNTSLWFDPVNWSATYPGEAPPYYIPPTNNGTTQTDTNINSGWDFDGEGVVYDPLGADAANYAAAAGPDFDYPTEARPEFDRDTIWRLYLTTSSANTDNKLTIKSGTLEVIDNADHSSGGYVEVGRGGAVPGLKGVVIQTGGTFTVNEDNLQIGDYQTNRGTGIYEYFGGTLEAALVQGDGIRIAHAGSSGPAAEAGTLIVHNGGEAGHIRTWNLRVASGLGGAGTNSDAVATVRFHANADGTRPIQVEYNLSINHQDDTAVTGNTRSAVLELALDAAPTLIGEVPIDMGLIDVDSDGDEVGAIVGESEIFYTDSIANGGLPYNEGDEISAILGNKEYFWNISYTGDISWIDRDTSEIDTILGPDNGVDVVLIGNRVETLAGLLGDYNNDGTIDAADYTVWRDNFGSPIPNDPTGGVATEEDFDYWKAHFGESGPGSGAGALGTAAVPEPGTMLLAGVAAVCLAMLRRRA